MIGLENLKPATGSRHRRKILGRGEGSGHGGSATRGMKGQKARSGDGKMPTFEGGQMPLARRIPKRGFTSKFRKAFAVINIGDLGRKFDAGQEIDSKKLREMGIVKESLPIKILGTGELTKSLTIKAAAFSKSAEEKIKKAGGTAAVEK
jgi:large subunit ribosomal protein L15